MIWSESLHFINIYAKIIQVSAANAGLHFFVEGFACCSETLPRRDENRSLLFVNC